MPGNGCRGGGVGEAAHVGVEADFIGATDVLAAAGIDEQAAGFPFFGAVKVRGWAWLRGSFRSRAVDVVDLLFELAGETTGPASAWTEGSSGKGLPTMFCEGLP